MAGSLSIAYSSERSERSLPTVWRSSRMIVTGRPYVIRPFISSSTAVSTAVPDTEAHQRRSSEAVTESLDGRRQVRPQPHRFVVGRVERHPNDGLRTLDTPRAQQRRLAVADRRVDHSQRGPLVAVEQLKQACSAQRPGWTRGSISFGSTTRSGGRTVLAV